jgi:Tfp pilus assembly protein PilP
VSFKYIVIYSLLGILILGVGCQRKVEPPPTPPKERVERPAPPPPIKPPEPTYHYSRGGRRDPFRALVGEERAEVTFVSEPVKEVEIFDLDSLTLSGLVWDEEEALALLYDRQGVSYILKRGRLLDPDSQPIEGVFGEIREEGVYLVAGEREVTLTLEGGGMLE